MKLRTKKAKEIEAALQREDLMGKVKRIEEDKVWGTVLWMDEGMNKFSDYPVDDVQEALNFVRGWKLTTNEERR